MRVRHAKVVIVAALCASTLLLAPVAAFADSTTTTVATIGTPAPSQWINSEANYLAKRHAVRLSYQISITAARAAFTAAISKSKNVQVRQSSRRALLSAIANADAQLAAALAQLGPAPTIYGELDRSEYELELVAINQDYADAVNTARRGFQAKVAAATNSAQIVTARAAMKLAIAAATSNRSEELATIGNPPARKAPPVEANGNNRSSDT